MKGLLGALRSGAWLLRGPAGEGRPEAGVLFIGSAPHKAYLARAFFADSCQEQFLGKLDLLRQRRLLHSNWVDCDLAFIERGPGLLQRNLLRRPEDLFIPAWLKSVADLPLHPGGHAAKWRRARRAGLTWSVTTDADVVGEFHDALYLPTIRARHGSGTLAIGRAAMLGIVSSGRGELLTVNHGGRFIAGQLILREQPPRLWAYGIRDADPGLLKMGALAAIYMFASQHVSSQGYSSLHMGMSRPLLNDGVLRYKARWNHRIIAHLDTGFVVRVLKPSGAAALLAGNPFVHVQAGVLKGALCLADVMMTDPLAQDAAAAREQLMQLHVDGLAQMQLLRMDPAGLLTPVALPAADESAGSLPAAGP